MLSQALAGQALKRDTQGSLIIKQSLPSIIRLLAANL